MQKVTLASSDKDQTLAYWSDLLKLKLYTHSERQAILGYADEQAKLEIQFIGEKKIFNFIEFPVILDYSFLFTLIKIYFLILDQKVEHCKAFGRIAFSCPSSQLQTIESEVKAADKTILTPFVSLDTPGKATVQVVILADPVIRYISAIYITLDLKICFTTRTDMKFVLLEMKDFENCLVWILKLIAF